MTRNGNDRRRDDARLRTLVTMNADGLLVVGRDDGMVRFANPAAAALLGHPADDLVGRPFGTPLSDGQTIDVNLLRAGGGERVAEVRSTAVDWDGLPSYLVALRDVTDQRRQRAEYLAALERERDSRHMAELAERRAAAADRYKDEFLAMLAHELRNPLAPLRNALYMLRQGYGNPAAKEWAWDVVNRQVRHLGRLVDGLLDVSRVTRGRVTLQREPVDVAALARRVADAARPLLAARRHKISLHLPGEAVCVEGDPLRLEQVFANLLDNAVRYTPPGGRVDVTVFTDGADAVIEVADTGVGISADLLPKVFDLFAQADRPLDRTEGGLGIGLTLAKRLVDLHGGHIKAESAGAGRGSTFTVRLPALATIGDPSCAPPHGRRVLVVDDNRDLAESLAMVLRLWGHDVAVAYDGPEALVAARERPPEVVFLDIGLPHLDGFEVARQMRAEPDLRRARIVAITGYGRDEDRRRAQEAGIDLHLTKPVDPADLQPLLVEAG